MTTWKGVFVYSVRVSSSSEKLVTEAVIPSGLQQTTETKNHQDKKKKINFRWNTKKLEQTCKIDTNETVEYLNLKFPLFFFVNGLKKREPEFTQYRRFD